MQITKDIGDYKIYNQIGKGSFGTVYRGVHKLTKQQVALKFILKKQKRPRDLKNLRQQNQLLRKINHQNVICLKDVIQTSKEIIIVTDYAGRDLSQVIEEKKKFSLDKVKQLSRQILSAMLYLNQNRIIHRDLKPQNILIKNNHIKICDFGFAKKLSASTNFLQSMKGTPLYLAPQIVRQTKYTQKVDVWSFGCIIYELYTGRTPYYANTFQKLAPLILYQQVQYPKDMPIELKQLICSMLQKNPSARPNWKQLKNHLFFQMSNPLKQKNQNNNSQIQKNQRQGITIHQDNTNNQLKQIQKIIIQSKVIQKLDNKNDIQAYYNDFKKIFNDLNDNRINGIELKKDIIFLHKIKEVFHQRSQNNPLISEEILNLIFNILNFLMKIKKNNQSNLADNNNSNIGNNNTNNNINNNNNILSQQDDITKNQTLIIAILCIAKIQKNYQLLQKQLRIICLLIKRNFNGVSINSQIDQQITQFVIQILLQKNLQLPIQCIKNGLIIIGTLANQALTTLNSSFGYFQRILQDKLLTKISIIYRKQIKFSIVLQCLKQFIHPIRQLPIINNNKNGQVLPNTKIINIFNQFKKQVAQGLLKTNFISEISPLQIYSTNLNSNQKHMSNLLQDYCQILLQCLNVSSLMRQQYLKYNYWIKLIENRKTKPFVFAFNSILIQKQNINTIPKQNIINLTKQSQQSKLINLFIIQIGYYNLKKKISSTNIIVNNNNNNNNNNNKTLSSFKNLLIYQKSMLQMLSDLLFIQQSIKQKSCKQIYGVLQSTSKTFDHPIIKIFSDIVENINNLDNLNLEFQEYKEIIKIIQIMFKKICSTSNVFYLNSFSFYKLMKIYTQSQIIKQLKYQKNIQNYFYQKIDSFIRNQQLQFIQNYFNEEFIQQFISKLIQCLNYLSQIDENLLKNGLLSQNSVSLSKLIQNSSFYRFMFIDTINQNQLYQYLKYTNKILSAKNSQSQPQFINFLGLKVISLCQKFIHINNQSILIQIYLFISQIVRDYSQFNLQIINIKIINKFKFWLTDNQYSQSLKQKVLYLIGNLAKRSEYFFNQFANHNVIQSIVKCLDLHSNNNKIYKNVIYSIGNISYYTQRFHHQIIPIIPLLPKAFQMNDQHLRNNLISTISNLVRFSNVYLNLLIQTNMIQNIINLILQAKQLDQTFSLALSVIKKIISYQQFIQKIGFLQIQLIYHKINAISGENNEISKKIKEILKKYQRKII